MQLIQVALLAAIGASAHPSLHNHRSFHAKQARQAPKEVWTTAVIDGKTVSWTGDSPFWLGHKPTTTAETPAPTTTAVAAAPPAATSSVQAAAATPASSSSAKTNKSPVSGIKQLSQCNKKRATQADIFSVGNLGQNCGGTYGSNLAIVDEDTKDSYKYRIKVTGNKDLDCAYWLKMQSDETSIGGFFENKALGYFTVPANEAKYLVAAKDSQGALACQPGGKLQYGGMARILLSTWAEWDIVSEVNKGYSGFDASCITGNDNGFDCNPLKMCKSDGTGCSIVHQGCGITHAFNSSNREADGLGGEIQDGSEGFEIVADYSN